MSRGRVVLTNAASSVLFGYGADEMYGMPVELLVPEVAGAGYAELRAQLDRQSSERAMGAGRHITACRKDGRLVPVDITLTSVSLPEGTFVIAIARDVAVYQRFLEACPIAIFVTESDRVTYANPAALKLVGASDLAELERGRLVDLVHPDDQPSIRSWMTEAVEAARETTRPLVEERIVRADGDVRYVRDDERAGAEHGGADLPAGDAGRHRTSASLGTGAALGGRPPTTAAAGRHRRRDHPHRARHREPGRRADHGNPAGVAVARPPADGDGDRRCVRASIGS